MAAPNAKLSCANISELVNILIIRGLPNIEIVNFYYDSSICHKWCQYCTNTKLTMLYHNKAHMTSLTADSDRWWFADITNIDELPISDLQMTDLLRQYYDCDAIDIEYLHKRKPLNRESAQLLLRGGHYHSLMREFITANDILAQFLCASFKDDYGHIAADFPEIFGAETMNLLITVWRICGSSQACDKSSVRDRIATYYSGICYNNKYFARDVINKYRGDLFELFPAMLICVDGYQHNMVHDGFVCKPQTDEEKRAYVILPRRELTDAICSFEVANNVMAFSNIAPYTELVSRCLTLLFHTSLPGENINAIARLIIEKYPQYLHCLYSDFGGSEDVRLVTSLELPEYDRVQLVMNNVRQNYQLMQYVPSSLYITLGLDTINKYIHATICDELGINAADTNPFCTLYDIYRINEDVEITEITENVVKSCYLYILEGHGFESILQPKSDTSVNHLMKLVRKNVNILGIVDPEYLSEIVPALYTEFSEELCD
jgi:hypothetical protein